MFLILTQAGDFKLKTVDISLADCLACSGCITSAEGVLINQQNQDEVLRILEENKIASADDKKIVVVTISQQALLSLGKKDELDPELAARHLTGYLKGLGVDYVLDTKIADDLALLEIRDEFMTRFRNQSSHKFPMLSSSCPGFVCYAEKTHGKVIIPHISTTRSPQQIMGVLVKQHLPKILNLSNTNIYHVTIMPCYDKKLEASRADFYDDVMQCRDVDCVITPIEVEQMLKKCEKNIIDYDAACLDWPWAVKNDNNFIFSHESSGSGGYAEHLFKYVSENVYEERVENLEFKNVSNPDFKEVKLEKNGETVLHIAIANGFRNIQNLVQKIKRGKCKYHFVEVMACPSGCLNGGAQVRPANNQPIKSFTSDLENLYKVLPKSNPDNEDAMKIYREFFEGRNSSKSNKLLHTEYHEIVKDKTALNIKW